MTSRGTGSGFQDADLGGTGVVLSLQILINCTSRGACGDNLQSVAGSGIETARRHMHDVSGSYCGSPTFRNARIFAAGLGTPRSISGRSPTRLQRRSEIAESAAGIAVTRTA